MRRRHLGRTWPAALPLALALLGACSDKNAAPADAAVDRPSAADVRRSEGAAEAARDRGRDRTSTPARWDPAAPLLEGRQRHTATLLQDGTLLVVGGWGSSVLAKGAERYDPKSDSWSAAGTLLQPRIGHLALRLADGRVLVVGGALGNGNQIATAELYDPTNTATPWKSASSLTIPRYLHCGVVLPDGRVLVAGGQSSNVAHTTLEVYDPQTGFWSTPPGLLSAPRLQATATLLKSGKVLIAAGRVGVVKSALATMDVYDPATGVIGVGAATLKEARYGHRAVALSDGRVLFVGGDCTTTAACTVQGTELYDPATDKLLSLGSQGANIVGHTATLLADGRVLLVAGGVPDLAALFDPPSGWWSQTVHLAEPRRQHTATLLPGTGQVLVVGGETTAGVVVGGSERYTP